MKLKLTVEIDGTDKQQDAKLAELHMAMADHEIVSITTSSGAVEDVVITDIEGS